MEGWISIHRKIKEWEWYTDPNPMRLFIHCLLLANHEPKNWKGIQINRGEFITSVKNLSLELKLSVKQIRVALNKLKMTNEVAIISTSQYTIIQVIKYSDYQSKGKRNGKRRANGGQTEGKRMAITNNEETIKELNKYSAGADWTNLIIEWLDYKAKRKETYKDEVQLKKLYNRLYKISGGKIKTAHEIIDQSMANNWAGLFELKETKVTEPQRNWMHDSDF